MGFHEEGLPALRAVAQAGYDVAAVITLTPEAAAKRSGASDYRILCDELGLVLHEVANINDESAVALVEAAAPDLLVVLGWSQILREPVLAVPRIGAVGAHASLLPSNRGRAPVNWAIIRGEKRTGNTLMWLATGVDSGDIIDQRVIPIEDHDSCATIYQQVAQTNRDMVMGLLERLDAGERPGRPQPHSDEPLLPGRKPSHGLIDWSQPAQAVYDLVRGVTRPYPGAFTHLDGERLRVWSCALLPLADALAPPGSVIGPVVSPDPAACGQAVACGSGAVVILEAETDDGLTLSGFALKSSAWHGKVMGADV